MSFLARSTLVAVYVGLFIISYFATAKYVLMAGTLHSLALPLDESIPFLVWTFWIYIAVYIVPVIVFFLLKTKSDVVVCFAMFTSALLIHLIAWLVYPVEYHLRPNLGMSGDWFIRLVDAFYKFDNPALNCFPSLHVTGAFLSYFVIKKFKPSLANFLFVLAILISISTLTFKQHYLLDVFAGFGVAFFLKKVFLDLEYQKIRLGRFAFLDRAKP